MSSTLPPGNPATPEIARAPRRPAVEKVVQLYGDLLFDLCGSILAERAAAQVTFRAIVKALSKTSRETAYENHQRAWVLRIALEKLRMVPRSHRPEISTDDQIRMDAHENVSTRLKHFEAYFHRLGVEDQMLLLLRDKYGLPYSEIATAMGVPEASLKVQRQQALRALEEWLWGTA